MTKPLFLNTPSILSALGDDIYSSWKKLFHPPTYLSQNSQWVADKNLFLGSIDLDLRAFNTQDNENYHTRNNRLLWHALAKLEPLIDCAKDKYKPSKIAIILGTSTSGADENIPAFQEIIKGSSWQNNNFNQTQQLLSSAADFIANYYQLSGLNYVISTACTSSANAMMTAARLIKSNLADAVICGGIDCLSKLTINGFNALEVLSQRIATPFSENRDGINIGEAAALFIISKDPLDDCNIQLLGYGASNDAWHMSSPREDGLGAKIAIQDSLNMAKIQSDAIGWINLHGTGTLHNDKMEAMCIHELFPNHTAATSTKPYTGHTLAAASALEAAFLWMSINREINPHGQLPAHYLPSNIDPKIADIHLSTAQDKWVHERRIGLSTSFAFGGSNAALIIGES